MLVSVLALVLGLIAVLIALSMRSHILSIRTQLSELSNKPADNSKDTNNDKDNDKNNDENENEVVEGFIDVSYTSGTERCTPDPLIPVPTEPPRDYIFTKMGLKNPYWDEEGYAMEQITLSDKENPLPQPDETGEYAKARIIPVIGSEWEYSQCPSCVRRYNYRGVV